MHLLSFIHVNVCILHFQTSVNWVTTPMMKNTHTHATLSILHVLLLVGVLFLHVHVMIYACTQIIYINI